jgi:glucose-6-phosphate 1-dehydrogenase
MPRRASAITIQFRQPPHLIFADAGWIEMSWELLMSVLEAWNAASATQVPTYRAGTWGPTEADDLFDRDWRGWACP